MQAWMCRQEAWMGALRDPREGAGSSSASACPCPPTHDPSERPWSSRGCGHPGCVPSHLAPAPPRAAGPAPLPVNTFSLVIVVQHRPFSNKSKRNHSDLYQENPLISASCS